MLVLSPLSVLPDAPRTGVGTALAAYGLRAGCRDEAGAAGVPRGTSGFLSPLGFPAGWAAGFPSSFAADSRAGVHGLHAEVYEAWMTGTLVYAQEFWKHDCVGSPRTSGRPASPQRALRSVACLGRTGA